MDDFSFYQLSELLTDEERFNVRQLLLMTDKNAHKIQFKHIADQA